MLGYEGLYEVSDMGHVRGVPRQGCDGRVLIARIDRRGYRIVRLCRKQVYRASAVHVLVCEAWHGPRPAGAVTRHLNGDSLDNQPVNLTWGTQAENMRDMVVHGRGKVSKTHCPEGHPYGGGNLLVEGEVRRCVECRRRQRARWWAANGKALDARRSGRSKRKA